MNQAHLDRRRFLEICLSLVPLAGCGSQVFADSERRVLADFEHHQERGDLLLAPYALALVESRYLPLPRAELRSLNETYSDQQQASLDLFYASGVAGGREALREALPHHRLLHIEASRWQEYFADPARFRSVSLDGKHRYAVPERDALHAWNVNADYVIVVGELRFEKSSTIYYHTTGDFVRCFARFLIWDYGRSRAIAEGNVSAAVGIMDRVTLQHWRTLGSHLVREILLKPPFLSE